MLSMENILDKVKSFQSVPSAEQVLQRHPDWSEATHADSIKETRIKSGAYSCEDKWQLAKIQDNKIYISTNPYQHEVIVKVSTERSDQNVEKGNYEDKTAKDLGLGFFSDQSTVDACKTKLGLDNGKYNDMCQIAPYNDRTHGEYNYKPHVDCFEIDRDKLEKITGSRDFYAAIAKCEANDVCGSGGGNQGYNSDIGKMIDSGCLVHRPEESYSRENSDGYEVSNPNPNILINNTVSRADYEEINKAARIRGTYCEQHNISHPSSECCEQTKLFEPNDNYIENNTGNAEIYELESVQQSAEREFVGGIDQSRENTDTTENPIEIDDKAKTAVVIDVKKVVVEEAPPLLHNLTSLQEEASQRLGMTAAETLACVQHLYEEGDATYPRTDSHYITSDMSNTVALLLSDTEGNS